MTEVRFMSELQKKASWLKRKKRKNFHPRCLWWCFSKPTALLELDPVEKTEQRLTKAAFLLMFSKPLFTQIVFVVLKVFVSQTASIWNKKEEKSWRFPLTHRGRRQEEWIGTRVGPLPDALASVWDAGCRVSWVDDVAFVACGTVERLVSVLRRAAGLSWGQTQDEESIRFIHSFSDLIELPSINPSFPFTFS